MKKILTIATLMLLVFQTKAQQLVGYEYFFDTDPGVGNGTYVAITPTANFTGNFNISTSALSGGFHNLCFRFKDAANNWSTVQARQFINLAGNAITDSIAGFEVFFDTEPGVGSGVFVPVASTTDYQGTINVIPPAGTHHVYVRAKNTAGLYSTYQMDTTTITLSVNDISSLEKNGIKAYPNPTTNVVNLDFDNDYTGLIYITITDAMGKIVSANNFKKHSRQMNFPVEFSALANGQYFIKMITEEQKPLGTAKILVSK